MHTFIDLQNGGVATVTMDTPTEYGEFTKSAILAHPLLGAQEHTNVPQKSVSCTRLIILMCVLIILV